MQRGSVSRFALRSLFASCGMFRRETPSRPRIPCVYGLEVGVDGGRGCWGYMSRLLFRALRERRTTLARTVNVAVALTCPGRISGAFPPARNYPWHTCAKAYWCYTCNCCFRAGWNSPLAVNRAVPKGCRGAGEASATGPMSPRPVRVLVRMPAELVRSQYQRLESG